MRTTNTIVFTLFLSSAQAFSPGFGIAQHSPFVAATTCLFSSPLDGLNREIAKSDDDEAPMTKAEQKEAAKEMKAEMKKLKDEAAAAAKEE
jgi:hypothetical protein